MSDDKVVHDKRVYDPVTVTLPAGTWYSLLGALAAWLGDNEMNAAEMISEQVNQACGVNASNSI